MCTLWALVPIAVWLWMARACGRGRNWARIVSTVLFAAATLNLTSAFNWLPPGVHLTLVPMAYGPTLPVLYWLIGLAAVWLLWRPSSRAFFRPPGTRRPSTRRRWPSRPSGADGRTRADPGTAAASRVREGNRDGDFD